VSQVSALGVLPLIEIDSDNVPLTQIADGAWDKYFHSYARSVAAYHAPIAIDFDHEFNGPWFGWGEKHQTAASFVSAWRRIVEIFRQNGATNVIWIWNPNRSSSATVPIASWYPGDNYVSWVGLDAYFLGATDTFSSVFDGTLQEIGSFTHKRIFVVETGANPGPNRVAQIKDLFAGLSANPNIIGFIWFDYAKYAGHDWLIDNDPAGLAALHAGSMTYQK